MVDEVREAEEGNMLGREYMYALQGVHELFEVTQSEIKWPEGEERLSKVVLVGKGLVESELQAALETCAHKG